MPDVIPASAATAAADVPQAPVDVAAPDVIRALDAIAAANAPEVQGDIAAPGESPVSDAIPASDEVAAADASQEPVDVAVPDVSRSRLLFYSALVCISLLLLIWNVRRSSMLHRLVSLHSRCRTRFRSIIALSVLNVRCICSRPYIFRACAPVGSHRSLYRESLRTPTVVLHIQVPVSAGSLNVLLLIYRRSFVPIVHRYALLGSGIVPNSAGAAAVGDSPIIHDGVVPHNCPVDIDIVNAHIVYPHNRGVICKVVAMPCATHKADAHVSESVVHAAVVAHVLAPISRVKHIQSA